jgi:hypothetical protein
MLEQVLSKHLTNIAKYYKGVKPGGYLSSPENRSEEERLLLYEMQHGLKAIKDHTFELHREIIVRSGSPKGAWAHVYYVSFHDPQYSQGPTDGFYPVFLLSVDHKVYWLSLCFAAATVGISGRGGWSKHKGVQLKKKAADLSNGLNFSTDWVRGPIQLGSQYQFLHEQSGAGQSSGRAYECGAILSKEFSAENVPVQVLDWLVVCFKIFDQMINREFQLLELLVPKLQSQETLEQRNASILGGSAEQYFRVWCQENKPDWGKLHDRTDTVGLGYDFEFPDVNLYIEVKGFASQVKNFRMTEKEWEISRSKGDAYFLALISHLEDQAVPDVFLVRNPHRKLKDYAERRIRLQVTYDIKGKEALGL